VKKTALEFAAWQAICSARIFADGVALALLCSRDRAALRASRWLYALPGFLAQQCFAFGFLDWKIFEKSSSSHTGFGFSDMPGRFLSVKPILFPKSRG